MRHAAAGCGPFAAPSSLRRARNDQPLASAQDLSGLILLHTDKIAGLIPIPFAYPIFVESMAALASMTFDGTVFVADGGTLRPLVLAVAISAVFGIDIGHWFCVIRAVKGVIIEQRLISIVASAPCSSVIPASS